MSKKGGKTSRYTTEHKRETNKIKKIAKHLKKNPNDETSIAALDKAKKWGSY